MTDTTETASAPLRLGGMALRNGLLVHGPTHWAAAVRTRDGRIESASGRKPRAPFGGETPGVRGVLRLGEAMLVIPLVLRGLPSARLPFQDARIAAIATGTAVAGTVLRRLAPGARGEAASALLSLAPALLTLRSGEVAAYHGVEHKAIAAYEQGRDDASEASKEHERCGSHLVAPMMLSSLLGTALLHRVVERPGPLAGAAVALASTGLSVEAFAWAERHGESPAARAFRWPGFAIQRAVGTREPGEEQLDVGRAALAEILRAEGV